MMAPPAIFLALASLLASAEGFQPVSPSVAVACGRKCSFSRTPTQQQHVRSSSSSRISLPLSSAATETDETTLTTSEMQTLFSLLADTTLLYDPSRGTCCRNRCSGCTYLDPTTGNFAYDEHTSEESLEGWLAPYVKVDFGERVQSSRWSTTMFPYKKVEGSEYAQPPKEVERDQFERLLREPDVSKLAVQSLWNVLSPSAGYPRLSSTEVTRAIKGMEGSAYEIGGAVNYATFEANMKIAAEQIVQLGGVDGGNEVTMDYDAMSKEELLEECANRGMKTTFPKMKRIIVEELRFFDAHGRQGKRHPVKNTLS